MRFQTRLKPSHTLIDLTPLVDVIFLMLIFFIVTSEILPLKSLLIETPELSNNSPTRLVQLIVVMDRDQVIYLGSKKEIIELGAVKEKLTEAMKALTKDDTTVVPTVVLHVDRRVDYGVFLKLFSQVQECSPRVRLSYKPK